MRTLTLVFYALVTFLLGVQALSSLPLALAAAYGNDVARAIQGVVVVATFAGPVAFLLAIPFAGTRRQSARSHPAAK